MYGLRVNGTLDMSIVKTMLLVEVISVDPQGNLSFRYGDVFTGNPGTKQIGPFGWPVSYQFSHQLGELVSFVRAKVGVAGLPQATLDASLPAVYCGVTAGNHQNQFVIHFINTKTPPADIYVYAPITERYKETGYGMNIYNDQGEVTFSTRRPILSDLTASDRPGHFQREALNLSVQGAAALSGAINWHLVNFGLVADKYAFSPMVTADDKLVSALSVFQGSSPRMSQYEAPTYSYIDRNILLAKVI